MRLVFDLSHDFRDNFVKAQMLDVRNDCAEAICRLTGSGKQLAPYEFEDLKDFMETLNAATHILKYFTTEDEFNTLTS